MRHELCCLFLGLAHATPRGWRWRVGKRCDGNDVERVGTQLLLRRGGGEDSEGEGRKRGVLDVRRGGTRDMADEDRREAPSWLCHMAYAYMQKGTLGRTYLYWVLTGDHRRASRRRGRRSWEEADSVRRRMYAHCRDFGWYTPVLDPGLDRDRDQQHASRCPRSCSLPEVLGLLDFRLHETTTRGYPYPRC